MIICTFKCKNAYSQFVELLVRATGPIDQMAGIFSDVKKLGKVGCDRHVICALLLLADFHPGPFQAFARERVNQLGIPLIRTVIDGATNHRSVHADLTALEKQLGVVDGALLVMLLHLIKFNQVKVELFARKYHLDRILK